MVSRQNPGYRIPTHDRDTILEPPLGPKRVYVIIVKKNKETASLYDLKRVLFTTYQLSLQERNLGRHAIRIPVERIGSPDWILPGQILLTRLRADTQVLGFFIVSERETDE